MMSFARWVSILAHPFVMVAVMIGVAGSHFTSSTETFYSVVVVIGLVLVPLAVLMIVQVRRKRWTNSDASNVSERPVLYLVVLVALTLLLGFLLLRDPHSFMVKGVFITGLMLTLASIVTRWVKVSLHLAFAGLASALLCVLGSIVGYGLLAVIPLLAWSRFKLGRHRPRELILGLTLGAVAGIALGYV